MPRNTPQPSIVSSSPTTTALLLFSLLLVCFFPGIFHLLWSLPLSLIFGSSSPPPPPPPDKMSWMQKQFTLPPRTRGSYLVTDHVLKELPEISQYKVGLLTLFMQHTSCALSLNENWDKDVRADMTDALDRIVPDQGPKGEALYRHDAEGLDDASSHVKASLIGASVTIPITDGKLNTGTWQGIWYLEFRDMKHTRKVVATIQGEKKA
ncbi:hypothetical protein QBC46DRAFT_385624 [Diplogelasinospora grovesii]|uniref:Uncharacterized protein n=1 Tax=Diplogelasinospora grovesii TaxID=303347 RepID=A0AAN6N848_9PEZI|nr:hypothetical protein QBC46DRAFT_385624 [Diplogelasinospora grovesii]